MSPSQACGSRSNRACWSECNPQLSVTVGGVGKTIFAYNQQLLLLEVLAGNGSNSIVTV